MQLTVISETELGILLQEIKLSRCDNDESSPTSEGQTVAQKVLINF